MPKTPTELIEVNAHTLGVGGVTICVPAKETGGKKIFVPGIIPGEKALVTINQDKKNYSEGKVQKLLTTDPDRVSPPCPYVHFCGGCSFQHMTIERERVEKIGMITSYLEKQGGLQIPQVINASSGLPEYYYRRRITLHLSHDGLLGFHKPGTGQVIPIDQCLLAEPQINDALPVIQKISDPLSGFAKSIEINNEKKLFLIVFLRNGITPEKLLSQRQLIDRLLGIGALFLRTQKSTVEVVRDQKKFKLIFSDKAAGHFSQVNRQGNQVLHDLVLHHVDITPPATITELYAGSGNFTVPLAQRGFSVKAVEFDAQLVKAGQALVKQLNLPVQFFQSSCEQYVRRQPSLGELVILDPPRAGAKDVIKLAHWRHTEKIIYISCDLASFSRDASALCRDHGFRVEKIFFVDMFPRTAHVELVGILRREQT